MIQRFASGSARVVSEVAQISNLLYRRISFCGPPYNPGFLGHLDALPITNRRYGRLQICATLIESRKLGRLTFSSGEGGLNELGGSPGQFRPIRTIKYFRM